MKICTKCKKEKSFSEFGKTKYAKSGYRSHCYECRNLEYKNRIKPGHPDFMGPIIPKNIRLCPDCLQFKNLTEVVNGHDKFENITYHNKCKKCYLKSIRENRRENPESYLKALRKYRQSAKGKETKKLYKKRLKVKVHNIVRDEIRRLVRKGRMDKSDTTCAYLGCDDETFIKHIESQFETWMNWDNYGPGYLLNKRGKPIYDKNGITIPIKQWSFDHINPCENFDLENHPEEAYKCFHYTNYRPLLAKENSGKGDLLPDGTRARYKRKSYIIEPQLSLEAGGTSVTKPQSCDSENALKSPQSSELTELEKVTPLINNP